MEEQRADRIPEHRGLEEQVAAVAAGAGAPRIGEYSIAPYALVVTARMSEETWPKVWFSWLSLKGHLQGFHYVRSTYQFTSRIADEIVAIFVVVFNSADAAGAWLEHGYTVEMMLSEMGVPESRYEVRMMRDFS
jgi:hypothetical protein